MNIQEKAVARKIFRCIILESSGQAFEDFFIRIMGLAIPGFKPVKPHGSIGDRKNDGYIKATATYYQVYAPEYLGKSHAKAVSKLNKDLSGLIQAWPDVRNYFFVINDKYKGPYPDAAQQMDALKDQYNLEISDFMLAKDLENLAFSKIEDDALLELVNFPPDPASLPNIDYSVLGEVINHIMAKPSFSPDRESLVVPDWDEKIEFNGLSEVTRRYLDAAACKLGFLEEFLKYNGDFASNDLRNRMIALYQECKDCSPSSIEPDGDSIFSLMLLKGISKQTAPFQDAFLVVLAKYFEACDVFEEPEMNDVNAR